MTENIKNENQEEQTEEILLVRLNTGEEVITYMNGATSEWRNPLIIHLQLDGTGKAMASLYPFMPNAKDKVVVVNHNHIQAVGAPDEKLLEHYLVSIGEKPQIIKPDTQIVVPKV